MRRNKKGKVYTNRTIKRCPLNNYLGKCRKSICKDYYLNYDYKPKEIIRGHNYYQRIKSPDCKNIPLCTKIFIDYLSNTLYHDFYYQKNQKIKRKLQVLKELASDVLCATSCIE